MSVLGECVRGACVECVRCVRQWVHAPINDCLYSWNESLSHRKLGSIAYFGYDHSWFIKPMWNPKKEKITNMLLLLISC